MATNKRKQGDGTVRLRSDGRWEGRIVIGYNEKGLPKTKSVTAKTKGECEDKLKALKEELGRAVERIKPDMPFGEWIDFWYQSYSKPRLRETTRVSYENCIYKHIIPSIGKTPLNKLTQNDLQQFYAKLKKNGRLQYSEKLGTGMSDRLVRSCHGHCRTALERAVKDKLISTNPSAWCKVPPKKGREMQVLTPNEITRFLAQAKEEGYYEMFLLELSTGMRRGEILGLKWGDVDLATGELRIQREIVRANEKTLITPPKTKSSVRTVVLPPYMTEILAKMKAESEYAWMFPSPVNLGEPRNPSAIYHRFQLILQRAGCKQVRFHDLRHTFATMALENGMDIKTLSAMIGHISSETTLNIYSHITDTMREQAAARIDRKIGGTDASIPEGKQITAPTPDTAVSEIVAPFKPKHRKPGTGCVTMINDHLYEGRYTPNVNGKRMARNVYASTREECEKKLAEMIKEMKTEIARIKVTATA